jgi:drug/metabolite transporter (DMT)-like permease
LKKLEGMSGYGAGVAFTLIVGFSFLSVKICIGITSPFEVLAWRCNFALLPGLIGLFFGAIKLSTDPVDLRNLTVNAALYTMFLSLQAIGMLYVTSVESGIIFAAIPIFTKTLASLLLGEHANRRQNLFMCLSITSLIALIACGASAITMDLRGVAILMVSGLSMSSSNVFVRHVRRRSTAGELALSMAAVGFLVCNGVAIFQAVQSGDPMSYFSPIHDTRFLMASVYLGVLSTFCTCFLMSHMLKTMAAMKAAIFGNLSSAISVAAGSLLLGEALYWYHIVFTTLIIAGVIGVNADGIQKKDADR